MVRKKYSKREIIIGITCAIILILVFTFYIWHQMEYVRIGYEIGELEEKLSALRNEVEELETQKSSLLSLERVEKIAKEELNLEKAKEEQIIYDDFNPFP
ncbi:MAG: cell division protein FtsL [Candidatus Aminicenantes bacterium]|nr:MAG: cell division protein FtsL [Candidatus Aminicenantes bacterium]